MPLPLAAMAAAAPAVGGLIEAPFKIYGAFEKMKMDREALREQKRNGRASRLHQLMADAGAMRQGAAQYGRLHALRSAGGTI